MEIKKILSKKTINGSEKQLRTFLNRSLLLRFKKDFLLITSLFGAILAIFLFILTLPQKITQLSKALGLKPSPAKEDLEYQLERLKDFSKSLIELEAFVQGQQVKIIEQKKTLMDLIEEKNKLETVVFANREVIDNILKIQETRNSLRNWLQLLLGGVLGFFTSILANIAHKAIKKKRKIKKKN